MPMDLPVLIVVQDAKDRAELAGVIHQCGLRPVCCATLNDAKVLLARERFSVVFCSEVLSDGRSVELIKQARKSLPAVPVVVVYHLAGWSPYVKAIEAGAFDYVAMPDGSSQIGHVLMCALDHSRPMSGAAAAA